MMCLFDSSEDLNQLQNSFEVVESNSNRWLQGRHNSIEVFMI